MKSAETEYNLTKDLNTALDYTNTSFATHTLCLCSINRNAIFVSLLMVLNIKQSTEAKDTNKILRHKLASNNYIINMHF